MRNKAKNGNLRKFTPLFILYTIYVVLYLILGSLCGWWPAVYITTLVMLPVTVLVMGIADEVAPSTHKRPSRKIF